MEFLRDGLGVQLSNLFDSYGSWLGTPDTVPKMLEFAEFSLAYLLHYNAELAMDIRWFAPWDEPNGGRIEYAIYEQLLVTMADRIKDPVNPPEVLNTRLIGALFLALRRN